MSRFVPVRLVPLVVVLAVAAALAPSARAASVFNDGNCPAGQAAQYGPNGFFDDIESRPAVTWTHTAFFGSDAWTYPASGNASSGDSVLHADDLASPSDSVIRSPVVTIGASGTMRLRFTHSWSFEANFDGGVVEMSVNGGAWTDIGTGAYTGTLSNTDNALSGRQAFTGTGASRTTFIQRAIAPGSTAQIRFRVGTDQNTGVAGGGWSIDDIGIYDCAADTTAPDTTITGSPSGLDTSRPSLTFSSNEAGVAFQCRVDGSDWQRCFSTRPLQPMTNGSRNFEVRAVDPAGNADPTPASQTITVAAPVPDTTIASGPTAALPAATTTPTFSLTSTVAGSTFACKIDGGSFASCSSSFTTSALSEGSHTLSVVATDPAGNVDATPATRTFAVDTTPPDTVLAVGPADGSRIADTTPAFLLTSPIDPSASFECKVDSAAYSPCDASWSAPTLFDGSHTILLRARDAAGNVDATPVSRTFTVDTAPPDTFIVVFPGGGFSDSYSDPTPTFGFAYDSPEGATFQCRLDHIEDPFDGLSYGSCSGAFTPGLLVDGTYTLSVRAVDPAGNVDPTPFSFAFTIDTVAPDARIDDGPAAGSTTADPTPTFSLGSSEAAATLACSVDDAPFATCPASFTTAALADGPHTLKVNATDAAGNVDASPATRAFTVDTSTPDTAIADGPGELTTDRKPTFSLTGGAAFECSVDDGVFAACPASFTTPSLGEGPHTVRVRAKNAAGTVDPTPATRTFTVDTTPPDTSITAGPDAGSSSTAASASFRVASSEDGASCECSLDGGDFAACAPDYTTPSLDLGDHVVAFRSRDAAGNTDPTPATRRFRVVAPPAPPTPTPTPKPPVTPPAPAPVPFALKGKPSVGAASVGLKLTVPEAGKVTATAKSGRTTLGSARATATRAGTITVKLALSRTAAALRRKGAVKATISLSLKPRAGGKTRTLSVKVTLPRTRP